MSGCAFPRLATGMAALSGQPADDVAPSCADPAGFYVSVVQTIADGYEVEHQAKVCYEHEHRTTGLDGYQQSRKIRIR